MDNGSDDDDDNDNDNNAKAVLGLYTSPPPPLTTAATAAAAAAAAPPAPGPSPSAAAASSPASSPSTCLLTPISAATVADQDVERRDRARQRLGPCSTGCADVDAWVLVGGGLERGSVVGVSADDEATGLTLGLQILAQELLLSGSSSKALLVTPQPASSIVPALRNTIHAQLRYQDTISTTTTTTADADDGAAAAAARARTCLERVMVSCVFDMDGLWEVLDDTDNNNSSSSSASEPPSLILVTHMTALLTRLFTQRDRSVAHSNLALLGARLRYMARTLASCPLIVLLNATTTTTNTGSAMHPSLNSIFNPPPLGYGAAGHPPATATAAAAAAVTRPSNKPSFGLVFSQLVQLHLLCWRRRQRTPTATTGGGDGGGGDDDKVTVLEVLQDEMGVWQGKRGQRPNREQRWTAVDVRDGRIVDAYAPEPARRPLALHEIRTSGGFGGRRP